MRIALVDISRGWGGAEEMLFSLAVSLRSRGHYVGLFLREGSETVTKFSKAGFDVLPVPRKGLGIVFGILKMIKFAGNKKFDLIHVHRNHDLPTGKILSCFSGNIPLLLTQHCWLGKTSFPLINLADKIITVSNFIADGIIERFPALKDKICVVHNGIRLEDFEHSRDDYWAGRPELSGKGPLLGVVGYFYKNQEELIELLPRIKAVFPEVMLIIIGRDDKKKAALENKAIEMSVADAVYFAGDVPHNEMKNALGGLDVSISAYRKEGFGLSVVEGMAVGVPFVGYRAGGYSEIVEDGINGFLADNQGEFIDVLINLLTDKEKYECLAENAGNCVRQRFSLDMMLAGYETIYGEALNREV